MSDTCFNSSFFYFLLFILYVLYVTNEQGVVDLFTRIQKNGYKMVYLSSRPIGQSGRTRTFLESQVVQEVKGVPTKLPRGPLIVSPDRLLTVLAREVVYRRAQEFKIEALRGLKKLFPVSSTPFYAGFGNRPSDVVSYGATGVPTGKIFIIDPKGVVQNASSKVLQQDYVGMAKLSDVMFPPVNYGWYGRNSVGGGRRGGGSNSSGARVSTASAAQDAQFNDVAFWSNRPGIIESEEERDGSSGSEEEDLGALSDNSDFEYFGGGEDDEEKIGTTGDAASGGGSDHGDEGSSGGSGRGGSGTTIVLDSPPSLSSLRMAEEKTPSSSSAFNDNDNVRSRKAEESTELAASDDDLLNSSIAAIAEIVASESLDMTDGEKARKENELAERERSSTLSNKSWRGISTTSVD